MVIEFELEDVPPNGYGLTDVSEQPAEGVGKPCSDCGTFVPLSKGGRQFDKCLDCRRAARGSATAETGSKKKPANWEAPLAEGLADLTKGIGFAVGMMVDQYDGMIILQNADKLGTALIGPAKTNPKVRKRLESMVMGGAWAGVAAAVASIAIPILIHHGIMPNPAAAKDTGNPTTEKGNEGHISV